MSVSGSVLFQQSQSPVIVLRNKYPFLTFIHIIHSSNCSHNSYSCTARVPVLLLIVGPVDLIVTVPLGFCLSSSPCGRREVLVTKDRGSGQLWLLCHSFDCHRMKDTKMEIRIKMNRDGDVIHISRNIVLFPLWYTYSCLHGSLKAGILKTLKS